MSVDIYNICVKRSVICNVSDIIVIPSSRCWLEVKPGGGGCPVPGGPPGRGVQQERGGGRGGGHLVVCPVLHAPLTRAPVLSSHLQPAEQ